MMCSDSLLFCAQLCYILVTVIQRSFFRVFEMQGFFISKAQKCNLPLKKAFLEMQAGGWGNPLKRVNIFIILSC